MLAVITLGAKREVIGRSKSPTPVPRPVVAHHIKTEILAVIVLIFSQIIEKHTSIHLLYIIATPGHKTCKRKQI